VTLSFIEAPHGPAWRFFLLAAIVVLAPPLFERIRLPGMVGLLVGGMLVGPNVANWITSADQDIPALGQVGLLFLMFMAGVELDLNQFAKNRRAAVIFGVITFAVPLALGLTAGLWLDYSVPASLLLGSLFASHTLVTYPAIRRLGLSRNTAVSTTVAATVLTDVLALLVLAVVSGSESGEAGGAELALGLVVGFAVLLAFSFGVLPRLVKRMFKRLARERTARFMVSLAALLAAGAMAEVFGVEAIVGAFFAGLALNRLVPNSGVLMERLEFVGSALLIPTFLVSVGLLINPAVLAEPQTLLLAAVFTAACLGGKALAAVVSIPILKMSRDEAGVVFALSSPQAAATLAAAFVGFEIGLFGERVVNAVLVLVMASLVVAPLAASTFGPRVSATDDDERPLGRAVLIPLPSLDRLRGLAWLAGRIAHADSGVVIPLVVADPSERGSRETTEMVERADGIMAEVGLDSEARVRVDHDPVAGIGLAVASESASLVVADWDPNDAERYRPVVEGSLAEAAPLLLVRLAEQPVERVVVWVSRRDHANRRPEGPTSMAIEVARRSGLPILFVAPTTKTGEQLAAEVEDSTFEVAGGIDDFIGTGCRPGDLVVMSLRFPWERTLRDAHKVALERGVSLALTATPDGAGVQVVRGLRAASGV
jgi:Kef-type K+ transport system membrane component KefB